MTPPVRRLIVFSAAAAIALMLLGVFAPVQIARVYLLALVAVAAMVVTARTFTRLGRLERLPRRERPSVETTTPPFFERAIRRVELAAGSGVYFEQLRPRLREIAEQRLVRHGLRLRSDGARKLLGEEAWLALERRPEGDKFAPPREGELRRVIEALERL